MFFHIRQFLSKLIILTCILFFLLLFCGFCTGGIALSSFLSQGGVLLVVGYWLFQISFPNP